MNNKELLARYLIDERFEGMMVRAIGGKGNWVVSQMMSINKWQLTLCNSRGTTRHIIGELTEKENLDFFSRLDRAAIDPITGLLVFANES